MDQLTEGVDFYWENGYRVFTEAYHLRRGTCCDSGCRHCPFPKKKANEIRKREQRNDPINHDTDLLK